MKKIIIVFLILILTYFNIYCDKGNKMIYLTKESKNTSYKVNLSGYFYHSEYEGISRIDLKKISDKIINQEIFFSYDNYTLWKIIDSSRNGNLLFYFKNNNNELDYFGFININSKEFNLIDREVTYPIFAQIIDDNKLVFINKNKDSKYDLEICELDNIYEKVIIEELFDEIPDLSKIASLQDNSIIFADKNILYKYNLKIKEKTIFFSLNDLNTILRDFLLSNDSNDLYIITGSKLFKYDLKENVKYEYQYKKTKLFDKEVRIDRLIGLDKSDNYLFFIEETSFLGGESYNLNCIDFKNNNVILLRKGFFPDGVVYFDK